MTTSSVHARVDTAVLPGDQAAVIPESGNIIIGQGLQPQENVLICTKAGLLRSTAKGKLWVEGSQKRYIPQTEDLVIGIIVDKVIL